MWRREVSTLPAAPCVDGPTSARRRSGTSSRDGISRRRRDNGEVTGFPLLLDLTGRPVVVVGGGAVAARRAAALPRPAPTSWSWRRRSPPRSAALGGAIAAQRPFEAADLDGAWLAMACTDDPAVNAAVAAAAEQRRIFCVRADAARGGTARTRRSPGTTASPSR